MARSTFSASLTRNWQKGKKGTHDHFVQHKQTNVSHIRKSLARGFFFCPREKKFIFILCFLHVKSCIQKKTRAAGLGRVPLYDSSHRTGGCSCITMKSRNHKHEQCVRRKRYTFENPFQADKMVVFFKRNERIRSYIVHKMTSIMDKYTNFYLKRKCKH